MFVERRRVRSYLRPDELGRFCASGQQHNIYVMSLLVGLVVAAQEIEEHILMQLSLPHSKIAIKIIICVFY